MPEKKPLAEYVRMLIIERNDSMGKVLCSGSLAVLLWASSVLAQIMPYSRNPWYWQYDGQPLLLVGGSG